jgi:hypothetical protein
MTESITTPTNDRSTALRLDITAFRTRYPRFNYIPTHHLHELIDILLANPTSPTTPDHHPSAQISNTLSHAPNKLVPWSAASYFNVHSAAEEADEFGDIHQWVSTSPLDGGGERGGDEDHWAQASYFNFENEEEDEEEEREEDEIWSVRRWLEVSALEDSDALREAVPEADEEAVEEEKEEQEEAVSGSATPEPSTTNGAQTPATRRLWSCVEPENPSRRPPIPLSSCANCRKGETYGAYYNAATHLRRSHFHGWIQESEDGRGFIKTTIRGGHGGGDDPPTSVLKQEWLKEIEEPVEGPAGYALLSIST